MSIELYNFHENVSQQDDKILDKHKSLLKAGRKWLIKDEQLLAMTDNVNYDQDGNTDQKPVYFLSYNF